MKKEDYERLVYQAKGNATNVTKLHMDGILNQKAVPVLRQRIIPESHAEEFLMENYFINNNPPIYRQMNK